MDDNFLPSAHLVGVCGAGMKALCELLLDRHWSITGSDLSPVTPSIQKLIDKGLVFHQGHQSSHLTDSTRQLVYSAAVPPHNFERIEAQRRQLPQFSYSQMVARLMRESTGVCIAGTHGKSTTSAMTAGILLAANRLSGAVVGAELCDGRRSGWSGPGDLFMAESCEFQQSFLDFDPKYSAILCIEPDHFDCYADLETLESAFRNFTSRTAPDGLLLVNDDCPVSREVSATARTQAKRSSFGFNRTATWMATDLESSASGMRFSLCHHGRHVQEIELRLHGKHNVCNALAAVALCAEIGVSLETIQRSLAKFGGIRRRFELVGDQNGVTIIDDYAHHPTAVKATLSTSRSIMGGRYIRCIFQPHQIRRTIELMNDFAGSFFEVDEVYLAPVFAARESAADEPQRLAAELAERIRSNGVSARAFASLDQIVTTLEDEVRPGDVIVTMGAGDIDRIHHELTRRL